MRSEFWRRRFLMHLTSVKQTARVRPQSVLRLLREGRILTQCSLFWVDASWRPCAGAVRREAASPAESCICAVGVIVTVGLWPRMWWLAGLDG